MIKKMMMAAAAAGISCTLAAGDMEFSLGYGVVFPSNRNLYLVNQDTSGVGTFVQTRFSGPWQVPSLEAGYEVARFEGFRTWVRAGYATSLGSENYTTVGQNVSLSLIDSQAFNGSAKVSRAMVGLGLTYDTGQLGEYGLTLFYRSQKVSLDGTLTESSVAGGNLTLVSAGCSQSATTSDLALRASMGLVQTFPTYKLFQRISMDWGFGGDKGQINGDASDWRMGKAFAERLKPTSGFEFAFGIRL